jgi:protein-S-isoprenylcysteine O-methyltransferase Ste14
MITPNAVIIFLWLCFYTYWLISAIGTKRNIRTSGRSERAVLRSLTLIAILFVLRVPDIRQALRHYELTHSNPVIQLAGIVLCVVGLAFAVWARRHLGGNWGQPMTFKEGHELVKTGPYRFVRHPIYAGILFAMLASALVSPFFFIPFIFLAVYFVYSARTEQRIMLEQFPDQYPDYMKHTKALVPFVW